MGNENESTGVTSDFEALGTLRCGLPDGIRYHEWFVETFKRRMVGPARGMVNKIVFAEGQREIELVTVTACELGCSEDTPYKEICDRAMSFNLEPVSADVGLVLLAATAGESWGAWTLYISMEPIEADDHAPRVFCIEFNGHAGPRLWTAAVHPNRMLGIHLRWVFARRKP